MARALLKFSQVTKVVTHNGINLKTLPFVGSCENKQKKKAFFMGYITKMMINIMIKIDGVKYEIEILYG